MYSDLAVRHACQIFYRLLEDGQLMAGKDSDKEHIAHFQNPDVADVVGIMSDCAQMAVTSDAAGNLYLFPLNPFAIFSYRNDELREMLGVGNNTTLYMLYFVLMVVLSEFYSSNNFTDVSRDFISAQQLLQKADQKAEELAGRTSLESFSDENNIRLSEAVKQWLAIPEYDERADRRVDSARSDRFSYIARVFDILKEHGYVKASERDRNNDPLYFVTPKLTAMIKGYYANDGRKNEILRYLQEDKEAAPNA